MKIWHLLIPVIIIALTATSCSQSNEQGEDYLSVVSLTGAWTDSVKMQPRGYQVNELTLRENLTFTESTTFYGIYSTQTSHELSAYTERNGNFVLTGKKIYFVAKNTITWDSFTGGNPASTVRDEVLFESCTFEIKDDMLILKYITYPKDSPEITTRQYTRNKSGVE